MSEAYNDVHFGENFSFLKFFFFSPSTKEQEANKTPNPSPDRFSPLGKDLSHLFYFL